MTHHEIKVSVGGGHELDRAGLAALIASLLGLRVIPLDTDYLYFQGQGTRVQIVSSNA